MYNTNKMNKLCREKGEQDNREMFWGQKETRRV